MDNSRRYFTRSTGSRCRSPAAVARTADAQGAFSEGPNKRRKLFIMPEVSENELLDALEGPRSVPQVAAQHDHSGTSNKSALLSLSALKASLKSSTTVMAIIPQSKPQSAASSRCMHSGLLAHTQPEQVPLTLPCQPALPTVSTSRPPCTSTTQSLSVSTSRPPAHVLPMEEAGYGSYPTASSRAAPGPAEVSRRRSSRVTTAGADQPPANGLKSLFESFLRNSSQPASSSRLASSVDLATIDRAAPPASADRPASAAAAPVAFWNRAYWNLAADEVKDRPVAASKSAAAAVESIAGPATASGVALQHLLQQQHGRQQCSLQRNPDKKATTLQCMSSLPSLGPSAGGRRDPPPSALLCSSQGLGSDSTHQQFAMSTDHGLSGFDIAAAAAAAAAGGPCMLSQGGEGMDNSGLDTHLLDATPGCDQSSDMSAMQFAGAGRTPGPAADDHDLADSSAADGSAAAAHADTDAQHAGSLDESHAVLLLTACMHGGVVEALSALAHTDGLPFRHKDGTGSLQMLLAYMLVVLQRADMINRLQEQEPHTLLTMIWMAEAFCSQYRNRLAYVLYDYKFYCKGVPYNDQAVQDVLKADVATCVATQKQILVGCGFGMWVEEPDMDAACQLLRQAGEGAYLSVLESAIADRANYFETQLQLLIQQHEAAQQQQQGTSVALGTVSPEFGQEQQTTKPVPAANLDKQQQMPNKLQATHRSALKDSTNVQQQMQQRRPMSISSTSAATAGAQPGVQGKPATATAASKGNNSSSMGPKQQLLQLTSKEQALGKRTRSSSNNSETMPPAGAVASKPVAKKTTRQSAGATLSSVWSKLLGGATTGVSKR